MGSCLVGKHVEAGQRRPRSLHGHAPRLLRRRVPVGRGPRGRAGGSGILATLARAARADARAAGRRGGRGGVAPRLPQLGAVRQRACGAGGLLIVLGAAVVARALRRRARRRRQGGAGSCGCWRTAWLRARCSTAASLGCCQRPREMLAHACLSSAPPCARLPEQRGTWAGPSADPERRRTSALDASQTPGDMNPQKTRATVACRRAAPAARRSTAAAPGQRRPRRCRPPTLPRPRSCPQATARATARATAAATPAQARLRTPSPGRAQGWVRSPAPAHPPAPVHLRPMARRRAPPRQRRRKRSQGRLRAPRATAGPTVAPTRPPGRPRCRGRAAPRRSARPPTLRERRQPGSHPTYLPAWPRGA